MASAHEPQHSPCVIHCATCGKRDQVSDIHIELCVKHVETVEGGRLVHLRLQASDARIRKKSVEQFSRKAKEGFELVHKKTLTAVRNVANVSKVAVGVRLTDEDKRMWTHCRRRDNGETIHPAQQAFMLEEFVPCACKEKIPKSVDWLLTNQTGITPGDAFQCLVDVGYVTVNSDNPSFDHFMQHPKHETFHVRSLKSLETDCRPRRHQTERTRSVKSSNSSPSREASEESVAPGPGKSGNRASMPELATLLARTLPVAATEEQDSLGGQAYCTQNVSEKTENAPEKQRSTVHIEKVEHVNMFLGPAENTGVEYLSPTSLPAMGTSDLPTGTVQSDMLRGRNISTEAAGISSFGDTALHFVDNHFSHPGSQAPQDHYQTSEKAGSSGFPPAGVCSQSATATCAERIVGESENVGLTDAGSSDHLPTDLPRARTPVQVVDDYYGDKECVFQPDPNFEHFQGAHSALPCEGANLATQPALTAVEDHFHYDETVTSEAASSKFSEPQLRSDKGEHEHVEML